MRRNELRNFVFELTLIQVLRLSFWTVCYEKNKEALKFNLKIMV